MNYPPEANNVENDIPNETPSPSPVPNWDQPPDAPTMTYNWVDITEDFKVACQG